jgi:hypothetical protein
MLPEEVSVRVSPIPELSGDTCDGEKEPGPGAFPLDVVHWYPNFWNWKFGMVLALATAATLSSRTVEIAFFIVEFSGFSDRCSDM